MYPEFIATTKEKSNRLVAWSFEVARKVEKIHANLFSKAIEVLKNKRELARCNYYVCKVYGNTVEDESPEKCLICNAPRTKFSKVA